MMSRRRRAYVRKHRQQFGGVYLDPRSHIWYYRRMVSGKRQLTRIGKLSEYATKALAKRASQEPHSRRTQTSKPNIRKCSPALHDPQDADATPRLGTHIAITSKITAFPSGAVLR